MNDYRAYVEAYQDALYHHGIKGQKWGVRRYQNPDGTLTAAGKARYYDSNGRMIENDRNDSANTRRVKHDWNNMSDNDFRSKYKVSKKRYAKRVNKYGDPYTNGPWGRNTKKTMKKAAIGVAAGAAGLGLAAVGVRSGAFRKLASLGRDRVRIDNLGAPTYDEYMEALKRGVRAWKSRPQPSYAVGRPIRQAAQIAQRRRLALPG